MGSNFDSSLDSSRVGGPIGERLLPHVIDAHAKFDPERVWASIARSTDLSQGFWDVKFRELARAVNNLAWYIHDRIGPGKNFETIGLVGIFDIRYALFLFASIKCGYKVSVAAHLFSSRNVEAYSRCIASSPLPAEFLGWTTVLTRRDQMQKAVLLFRTGISGQPAEIGEARFGTVRRAISGRNLRRPCPSLPIRKDVFSSPA